MLSFLPSRLFSQGLSVQLARIKEGEHFRPAASIAPNCIVSSPSNTNQWISSLPSSLLPPILPRLSPHHPLPLKPTRAVVLAALSCRLFFLSVATSTYGTDPTCGFSGTLTLDFFYLCRAIFSNSCVQAPQISNIVPISNVIRLMLPPLQ